MSTSFCADVIVLGTSKDDHISRVLAHLPSHLSVFRLNIDEYPVSTLLTWELAPNGDHSLSACSQGICTDLLSAKLVWFRRLGAPGLDPALTVPAHRAFALAETENLITSLAHLLQEKAWINRFDAARRTAAKPFQLFKAWQCGLEIPLTTVTNAPSAVPQFAKRAEALVYKTLASPSVIYPDKRTLIFTHKMSPADLAIVDDVRFAPCQFQAFVEKLYELRITAIGRSLFPVKIFSQSTKRGTVDWRAADAEELRYEAADLPASIENKLLALLEALDLQYAAIDMIVTPTGEYVFLEANPHGAWLWLEDALGIPISQEIAQYIASETRLAE